MGDTWGTPSRNTTTSPTYQLCALLRESKRRLVLVSGLESPDQGRYLEYLIEKRLKLVDRPIAGELLKNRSA